MNPTETLMKNGMRLDRKTIVLWALAAVIMLSSSWVMAVPAGVKDSAARFSLAYGVGGMLLSAAQAATGESQTLLPSGQMVCIGGQDASGVRNTAFVENRQSGAITPLAAQLQYARAWHTATLLPDGSVFVLGGVGAGGMVVSVAERLDAAGMAFATVAPTGLTPRAFHTATLLTDGRVLVTGGIGADGSTMGSIELWDFSTGQATTLPIQLLMPRSLQLATLLPDGTVLIWGGVDNNGQPIPYGEIIDPIAATVRMQATVLNPSNDPQPPQLEVSLPSNGATGVSLSALLSLRFSKPLNVTTVNVGSVVLTGPDGAINANTVPAEGGILVFVTPQAALAAGSVYTLSLTALTDNLGQPLTVTSITFTTAGAVTGTATGTNSGSGGDTDGSSAGQGSPASSVSEASTATSATQAASSAPAGPRKGSARITMRRRHSLTPVPYYKARQAIASGQKLSAANAEAQASAAGVKPLFNLYCPAGTPPAGPAAEIVELARALNNDPDLIYQFVHDNIEFSPLYGALKGPVGTLLDGRGNAFDQASLMVVLLNQASLSNSAISNVLFEFGQLSLTNAQLTSWLGVDGDPNSIGGILAQGNIPGTVDPSGNATLIGHVWVKVSINGVPYVFDPAFKAHNWTSGIAGNLAGIMGYSRAQFFADANPNVTSTAIQGVNRNQLRNDLTRYAGNLAAYIKNNYPNAGMADIVGGGTIVPTPFVNGQTVRQSSNPNQAGPPSDEEPSIPGGYHAQFFITIETSSSTCRSYNADDIYGHRLSIFFDSNYVPTLYLDGAAVMSGGPSQPGDQAGVNFQVQPVNGALELQTSYITAQSNLNGAGYVVVNGWDQVGRGMIEKHRKLLSQAIASGAAANSEPVLGESLALIGYTWLAENATQQHLSDRLLGTTTQYYCGIGIAGEAVGTTTTSPYVDLPLNVINTPARINGSQTANSTAAWLDISGAGSSFESGVLEQTQAQVPGFVAASTIKLLDIGLQNGDTIFDINNGNTSASQQYYVNTIRPQLAANYAAGDLANVDYWVNQGYRVIAPLHDNVSVGSWTGVGFKAMQGSSSAQEYGEFISGNLNGGFGGVGDPSGALTVNMLLAMGPPTDSATACNGAVVCSQNPSWLKKLADPVDHRSGSYLYQHDDLTVGAKSFPYGLGFQRSYASAAQGVPGPLGNGWTHNYAVTAQVGSDGFTGMGEASPLNAVSSIVALYVSSDLMSGQAIDDGTPNVENFVLETVVNRWFTDRLTGNVVNITQPGNTEQFTLMADGVSYAPPLGSATILDQNGGSFRYRTKTGVTITFNPSGQISSWSNAAGASVNFSYGGRLLSSVANSATGRQLTLSYSGGLLTLVTDGSRTVNYSYSNGNLSSFTDALGQKTTFAYDTSGSYDTAGHLTQVFYPTDPNHAFITNFYDSLGRVKQQTDADGNTAQLLFAGARTEMVDALGVRHVLYNDSRGNVRTDIQDYGPSPHRNLTTLHTYNAQKLLMTATMPEGNFNAFAYDTLFNPSIITQVPKPGSQLANRVQQFAYMMPAGSLPNFEEVATATDPNGNVTSYQYDGNGNLQEIDPPAVTKPGQSGNVAPKQVFTYTNIGLVQTSTDAEGRITRYDYDSNHADQLIRLTVDYGRLNLVTQYGYDSYGDINSITDANGNTTTSIFDVLRRLTEVDAPVSGVVTKYTYYPNNKVASVQRAAPGDSGAYETTQYTYTPSYLLQTVTDPLGNTTTTTYDADDRVQTVTQPVSDSENRQRTYSYDALGRLVQLSDTTSGSPGTVLETHSYTPNGREQSFADANNSTTTYAYDGFDQRVSTTYPDQSAEQYQYDADGNLLQKATRSGQTIAFAYDPLNRVVSKNPQGEAAGQVSYGYDLSGRLLQAADGSSPNPYLIGYDTAGRADSYTDQQGRNTQVQYDGVGNRTMLQWPAGSNGAGSYYVTYQYDALNRMIEIDENGSPATPLAQYQWDTLSRLALITYGDGTTDAYSQYDAGDNLQTLTHTFTGANNGVTFSYTWLKNHQRQSVAVDNSLFQHVPTAGTITYGPADADNAYTSSGDVTYNYDGNHNLTFDGTNTLTYDVENRLIGAQSLGVGTTTYSYDPLGHRSQKQTADPITPSLTVTTQFVLAGNDEIADYNCFSGTCTPWTLTVRGVGGLPVASIAPASGNQGEYVAYYHHDVLGSTTAATAAGTDGTAETYVYGEFGISAGGTLPYRFAGYRYDTETGLYYVRARYYSPSLGRFLQADPIGFADGRNLYAYVGNDPINFSDPSGLAAEAVSEAVANAEQEDINNSAKGLKGIIQLLNTPVGPPVPVPICEDLASCQLMQDTLGSGGRRG
jgi:RHS repeat-associated protein